MAVKAQPNGGLSIKVFDGVASAVEKSYELPTPCRYFAFQLTGSTSAVVNVIGHLMSSADSTGGSVLLTWSSDTEGSVLSTESTAPFGRVSVNFSAGSSADAAVAVLTASP